MKSLLFFQRIISFGVLKSYVLFFFILIIIPLILRHQKSYDYPLLLCTSIFISIHCWKKSFNWVVCWWCKNVLLRIYVPSYYLNRLNWKENIIPLNFFSKLFKLSFILKPKLYNVEYIMSNWINFFILSIIDYDLSSFINGNDIF